MAPIEAYHQQISTVNSLVPERCHNNFAYDIFKMQLIYIINIFYWSILKWIPQGPIQDNLSWAHVNGLVYDCSNSISYALQLLQSLRRLLLLFTVDQGLQCQIVLLSHHELTN